MKWTLSRPEPKVRLDTVPMNDREGGMSGLVFHERVGLEGRRISPFSWRIRYALAHKGLHPEVRPTRFADVERIRTLSRQELTPILEDGDRVVHDSWTIACHLEDRFPDRPSLFGGEIGRGTARLVNLWSDTVLHPPVRRLILADFIWCLDPGDRGYFRRSREAQYGASLEEASADRESPLLAFTEACRPLARTLDEQPFLAGGVPAYVDYVVFSVFQWARIGTPQDILGTGNQHAALPAWQARMIGLYDNLADRFGHYPDQRSGSDGR
jgi:glutathione S-transferase